MAPLLSGGYILTLDMVFGPHVVVPSATTASFVFYGTLKLVSAIVPVWLVQIVMLSLILVLSGVGMHRLMVAIRPGKSEAWTVATYFAGVLFVVNPFVYSRFMAGQFAVLLGYMLLPFIARSLIRLHQNPSAKQAVKVGACATLIGIVSLHTLGLAAIIAGAIAIAFFTRKNQKKWLAAAGIAVALFVVASSYWLVPFISGSSEQSQQVASFTAHDTTAFATDTRTLGAVGNVLAMHGFWGDGKGLYQTTQDVYTWWLVPIVAVWFLVALGGYSTWKFNPRMAYGLGALLLVSVVLAAGPQAPVIGKSYAIIDQLPFFGGYREPQKFTGVIVLVYGVFAAWGVVHVVEWMRSYWRKTEPLAVGCLLLLPIFCAPLMLWGFKGQLVAADYPLDWYEVNARIPKESTVLYLPWHHYMRYDFAGRVIANPAPKFFDARMVYSNDPELRGVGYVHDQTQRSVQEQLIPQITQAQKPIGSQLQRLGIEYVIVVKEHDYMQYDHLQYDNHLKRVQNSPHIMLYEVREP